GGSDGGEAFEAIYTAEAYYSCANDQCVKFPISQSDDGSGFQPSDYIYDDEKLSELGQNARYVGKRDCPAGQCDVWDVTDDGETSTLYIGSDGRISQVTASTDEGEVKIVYTFKPITIEVPANAQEIPALQP